MVKKNLTEEQKQEKVKKARIGRIIGSIFIIISLIFISILIAGILGLFILTGTSHESGTGNVALIKIYGPITTTSDNSLFSQQTASAENIIKMLDDISKDPTIKAVILDINSGGGSGVAADEISHSIKKLRDKNITIVSYIRDMGTSAAYWIASSSEFVVANRLSFVGSIGVLSGFLDFSRFIDHYNISYERFVAGESKDFGTPFRPVTESERKEFQQKLNLLHLIFIEEIATNRNLSFEHVEYISTGMIFTSSESAKLGLIDKIGYIEDAIQYIEDKNNMTAKVREFGIKKSLLDVLFQSTNKVSYNAGRGIGDSLVEQYSNQRNIFW